MDVGLESVPTAKKAIDLIKKYKALCKIRGLNLHKFPSNRNIMLAAIAPDDMNSTINSLDFSKDTLPIGRTLGVVCRIG